MLKLGYFGHLQHFGQLIGKDPDAGQDWRQKEKREAKDEIDSINDSMDMGLSKLGEIVKDKEAWRAAGQEVAKNRIRLSDWSTISWLPLHLRSVRLLHDLAAPTHRWDSLSDQHARVGQLLPGNENFSNSQSEPERTGTVSPGGQEITPPPPNSSSFWERAFFPLFPQP